MVFSRIPVPYLWWRIACIFSRTELIVHQQQTTTFVLRPFSSLREGLAGGSPWQFPSLSVIMRILLFQSTISHVPFHHLTPRHLPPSSSCRAFHFIRRAFLHPVIIILPHHMFQPSQPVPLHNVRHWLNPHFIPQLCAGHSILQRYLTHPSYHSHLFSFQSRVPPLNNRNGITLKAMEMVMMPYIYTKFGTRISQTTVVYPMSLTYHIRVQVLYLNHIALFNFVFPFCYGGILGKKNSNTVNSLLTDTFLRRTLNLVPAVYWLFYYNQTLSKTETTCVQKISAFFVVCLATGHTLLCLTDNNSKLYYCSFIKTRKGKYPEVSPICKGFPKIVKKERF